MPSEITAEQFHNLPSPSDLDAGRNCGDDGQRECTLHNLHCGYPNCPKGKSESDQSFQSQAKKYRDERNNAWDEFVDLSCQAGYNIKNTLANRSLFMGGYESGKEARAAINRDSPEWVAVDDSVPSQCGINEQWCLVTRANRDEVDRLYWREWQFGYLQTGIFIPVRDIIAWMPLPKPFKQPDGGGK